MIKANYLLPIWGLCLLFSCTPRIPEASIEHRGSTDFVTINSQAIADNTIKEMTSQTFIVMLPPDYSEEASPFKVVYFLSGYDSSARYLSQFSGAMNNAMKEGLSDNLVFVCISGVNRYGGSFYRNSSITGNWEDYIIEEIIPVVEGHYNVRTDKEGRGLAGHSMGGFGALHLGLDYSKLFNAVLAYGPAVIRNEDLPLVIEDWKEMRTSAGTGMVMTAYAESVTESPEILLLDGTEEDNRRKEQWLEGLGNWDEKIKNYSKNRDPLTRLKIIYGENEDFPWIAAGSMHIKDILEKYSIPNSVHSVEGSHSLSNDGIINNMLPFFSENLE